MSESMTFKGVFMESPGVNRATGPNESIGTRVSRVTVGIVEKVIPLPIFVFVCLLIGDLS